MRALGLCIALQNQSDCDSYARIGATDVTREVAFDPARPAFSDPQADYGRSGSRRRCHILHYDNCSFKHRISGSFEEGKMQTMYFITWYVSQMSQISQKSQISHLSQRRPHSTLLDLPTASGDPQADYGHSKSRGTKDFWRCQ
jgi:hypothetical protein